MNAAASDKKPLQKIFASGEKYSNVRINDVTPNLTPNQSFSDSFITPNLGKKNGMM